MNQFEDLIFEESINICRQLNCSEERVPSTVENMASLVKDDINYEVVNPRSKMSLAMALVLLGLTALILYLFLNYCDFQALILQSYATGFTIGQALNEIMTTLGLALIPTLLGSIMALLLGLLISFSLLPRQIGGIIKGLVVFVRTIPTIIWVIICVVVAGFGSGAVVMGLTLHSVGYLTKAYGDSFEGFDQGAIEALRAIGADWWQIVFRAVIPSYISNLFTWTCLRLEINLANAIAIVVAGTSGALPFDWRNAGIITYFVLVLAIALEVGSRNRNIFRLDRERVDGYVDQTGNRNGSAECH